MDRKKLIEDAIANITDDRAKTQVLLAELLAEFAAGTGDKPHTYNGNTAAKYVETLQRSNEQLVKIISIISKSAPLPASEELSEADTNDIYDLIQEDKANSKK
tara:strand:- start:2223 stop:2531 length:309 start_codon:yes stop_codon:yes gene_type:complete